MITGAYLIFPSSMKDRGTLPLFSLENTPFFQALAHLHLVEYVGEQTALLIKVH